MSITEFASLELISPHTLANPEPLLAKLFERLADWQASWSSHQLLFFTNSLDPSKIYLVTGWKDIEAHQKWIASDQNQELLFKFKRFLKVNRMVHLDMDFNKMPTDKHVIICERYASWSEVEKGARSAGEKEKESEVLNGSKTDVEWAGAGKVVDPPQEVDGSFYKFSVCSDEWKNKIVSSATSDKDVVIMERVDMRALPNGPQ